MTGLAKDLHSILAYTSIFQMIRDYGFLLNNNISTMRKGH